MSSRPSRGAARLAAILDALPDALLLVNCNGTVVNANTIALEAFETPGTALVGRGLLDLLPEFDSKRIPGSMRRPEEVAQQARVRTKPTRMVARRTDGTEFPVEVTSANLEDGRTPYASAFEAAFADHGGSSGGYTGDELLMLVVRDLTGTLDTEAELGRQQRQTEMILRAASEGVVGVDAEGRVVLVNPAAAQILGYRASDLGGQQLHPLVHHSRPDGTPLSYEETPLADTLRSGRKHRVRAGQVLWSKDGTAVPVDMTTAPVRDGEQLVGAVLAFTDRRPYETVVARHQQLRALLGEALRGPLEQLRGDLTGLAADPAGQLWPEANQVLHHLAAGYARMTTLVDNVLSYQRLDAGQEKLATELVALDGVVSAGVEGAVELIGPGRAQFAVHAPPIEAEVDPERMATALAHLIADVAGVDATGQSAVAPPPGVDPTIVVAAAQRGDVVRIEVRGPHGGGSPVHEPLVRGIVRRHGGVLQTHEVPGAAGGSAYVLEVPVASTGGTGGAGGTVGGTSGTGGVTNGTGVTNGLGKATGETTVMPVPAEPARGTEPVPGPTPGPAAPMIPAQPAQEQPVQGQPVQGQQQVQGQQPVQETVVPETVAPETAGGGVEAVPRPTGRRRGRPSPAEEQHEQAAALEQAATRGGAIALPPGGSEGANAPVPAQGSGRRARRALADPAENQHRQPMPLPAGEGEAQAEPQGDVPDAGHAIPAQAQAQAQQPQQAQLQVQPGTGRRARGRAVEPDTAAGQSIGEGEQLAPGTPGSELEVPAAGGRRARRIAAAQARARAQAEAQQGPQHAPFALPPATNDAEAAVPAAPVEPEPPLQSENGLAPQQAQQAQQPQQPQQAVPEAQEAEPEAQPQSVEHTVVAASPILGGGPFPQQPSSPQPQGLPMPEQNAAAPYGDDQGPRVRTLGQGMPFSQRVAEQAAQQWHGQTPAAPAPAPAIPSTPSTPLPAPGSGRRRKLGTPQEKSETESTAPGAPGTPGTPGTQSAPAPTASPREFSIGSIGKPGGSVTEGPEPLDGPDSPVEVTDGRGLSLPPQVVDDELPPEPLDNPRRLLVWPEPDVSTQQALSDRGYRPVLVHSREEVDAQIAAYPAALFVDPLTGPITRTALQSLRTAAVAAEVPVLVTAGLGQATREAAYGADPAVLLKALAPRDSEQHPPRVLLVEEHEAIAGAFAATLERRGMQVAHAPTDSEAVNVAAQVRPNLVVMDLMQVRRRRAGIIDWLRVNGLLNRTPFVVYTSADMDPAELPRLASGETVLFLAERSTNTEVQSRIVDLLTKIGAS
ncbi:PAS domain-containing protein [Streptomyces sp. NPDC048172]|uniref:response regulator n=1 Tax=Streptomyces sp. NPDC048172 TaxID=3365505 RepID=UPI0037180262